MNVRHLVVAVDEIFERYLRALFDAEINQVAEVPSGSGALCVSIVWLLNDWISPELGRHRWQPEGREKFLGHLEDFCRSVALLYHFAGHIRCLRVRFDNVQDVSPILRPHVAQQMCGYGAVGSHHIVTVLPVETASHESEELLVQRLDLAPQVLHSEEEIRIFVNRSHLLTCIAETVALGRLICQVNIPHKSVANRRSNFFAPFTPHMAQLFLVPTILDYLCQLRFQPQIAISVEWCHIVSKSIVVARVTAVRTNFDLIVILFH